MATATESYRPSSAALLAAMIGGIATWAGRFTLGYLFVPTACEVGVWLQHAINGTMAVVAALFVLFSVRLSRRPQDPGTRYLFLVGAALNVFFLAAILLETSSALSVDPCAKGAIP